MLRSLLDHGLTGGKISPPDLRNRVFQKITIIFLLATALQAPLKGFSQNITLNDKRITLKQVFAEIKKQTKFALVYNPELVNDAAKISVNAKNQPLEEFLQVILAGQPINYTMVGTTIVIYLRPTTETVQFKVQEAPGGDFTGMVFEEKTFVPLGGVSVVVIGTGKGTQTNEKGVFTLKNLKPEQLVSFTFIGYETVVGSMKALGTNAVVTMKIASNELDQAVVQAYGITSKRLATGNITKISGEELRKQPVMNPLMALQGRVPGMLVTPTTGHASSPIKVEIRGRNSLNDDFSGEPLYVIDGVPRIQLDVAGSIRYNRGISPGIVQGGLSVTGGQSMLYGLNTQDIESIEVLKDGDATAIYGSRAANGVILITTRKAKPGKTSFELNINQGITDAPYYTKMMNTQEYLAMRREAFKNDGQNPTIENAPDLMLWDTTRYTNWQKELLGIGQTTAVNAAISGGDMRNTFRISANYNTQKGRLNKTGKNETIGVGIGLNHKSQDQKLNISFDGNYSYTYVDAIDLPGQFDLPPNAPAIYDEKGNFNFAAWNPTPMHSIFPFARLRQPSIAKTNSLGSSLNISYELMKGLSFNTRAGFNHAVNSSDYFTPIASQNPALSPTGFAAFGVTRAGNWMVEPQLTYSTIISKGRLTAFVATSIQSANSTYMTTFGAGYNNDDLIRSVSNAPFQQSSEGTGQHKFASVFGRLNYSWEDKYIINLNARRDGSSRFAAGRQYGNFGSLAGTWNASEEKWMKKILPSWITFIQFRTNYAITGNDGIGDYQYLSQWTAVDASAQPILDYDDIRSFIPVHAVNQDYHWESNKKFDVSTTLAFMNNRITLDVSYFRNISDDQLTTIPTPIYSGFPYVTGNSKAKIANTGWEGRIRARIIETKDFSWTSDFAIWTTDNKLLDYPGLEYSPHATLYKIGQSLNTHYVLHYLGINPLSGEYSFEDYDKDGRVNANLSLPAGSPGDDRYVSLNMNPDLEGSTRTDLRYKAFNLGFAFTFRKGLGYDPISSTVPGRMANLYIPDEARGKYWRKPGDHAIYPRFSTSFGGSLNTSDGAYTDISFLRLNNISFSWSLPEKMIKKAGMTACFLSVSMQNIFTITNYKGVDPTTPTLTGTPQPRIINGSLSFNF